MLRQNFVTKAVGACVELENPRSPPHGLCLHSNIYSLNYISLADNALNTHSHESHPGHKFIALQNHKHILACTRALTHTSVLTPARVHTHTHTHTAECRSKWILLSAESQNYVMFATQTENYFAHTLFVGRKIALHKLTMFKHKTKKLKLKY